MKLLATSIQRDYNMKVCFWGDNASALNGNPTGGGELQIALLAKALIKLGHKVVFVDYNIQEDYTTEDGIRVHCIKGYNEGIRMLRTFRRFKLIYMSLREQEADAYYCRIRDFRHILAYWASRKVKARFILALASDLDVKSVSTRLKYLYFADTVGLWWFFNGILSEIVYSWLLHNSDLILAQHDGQKNILVKKNIKCIVLHNMIEINKIPSYAYATHEDFCYVGSLDKRKGFVDFYNLVKVSSTSTFKIIGSPRDKTGELYCEKLRMFNNVTFLGRMNHQHTLSQISNSKALISTSPMEGFPNIFIEAWACGIPVLSLFVDPGEIIEKEGLGYVANGELTLLSTAMEAIKTTPEDTNRMKAYVMKNHALNEGKLAEINNIFCELTGEFN